jgi:DNA mismatch repair protein MutS
VVLGGTGTVVDLEARERERNGIASLRVAFNRVHGFYIEISNANAAKVPTITAAGRR